MIRRFLLLLFTLILPLAAQSRNAATVELTVTDPSGAPVPGATAIINNPLSGYSRTARTDANGVLRFTNLPLNHYHLEIDSQGFSHFDKDLDIHTTVPVKVSAALVLGTETQEVNVEGHTDLIESVPYAHNDLDRNVADKLPTTSPGSGLSDAITFATPGVVADSNGLFHPLGDHAQVTYSLDGQSISDQQSKQFSTQIPLNALDSLELITGAASAEFGDKTSLVVNATTRSGLGQKPTGSFTASYGSFGTIGEEATLGLGGAHFGNFLVVNASRSGRFLDTPEFRPFHAIGNTGTIFDRVDFQPTAKDSFHLNVLAARNWFQIPNTLDQAAVGQDQRQQVLSYNIAPGYQRVFDANTLFTVTPYIRRDAVDYYPSRDPFADSPVTVAQRRTLLNWGVKADVNLVRGRHNIKFGTQLAQTRLNERFSLGLTDFDYNAVCLDKEGNAAGTASLIDPTRCGSQALSPNPNLLPGLLPYDLTRGGSLFQFRGSANINQQAFYVQDNLKLGHLNVNAGLRVDNYDGLSQEYAFQPRIGASYNIKRTHTLLRGSYSRNFETPYNENLVLSSSTGSGGLAENVFGGFGAQPLRAGNRNQFNLGLQQAIGKWILIDADYVWKYTNNAFDFGVILNTPITFPISWKRSKIDGVSFRVSTPDIHGFQVYMTAGHTRSRFFGPSNGGLIFNSPLETAVFRIDHDQAFQQTTNLRYQYKKTGPWFALTWRYDSGLVAGAVGSLDDALALSPAEQSAIGFYCGGQRATPGQGITTCDASRFGATRLRIPAPGTADDDHNPPRIAPRHIFDLGFGTDNLYHTEHLHTFARVTITNLANQVALYNFQSTFSGTHFVTPRSVTAQIGIKF